MLERVLMSTESLSASRRLVMRLAIRVAVQKGSPVQSASATVARTVWMVDMLADWQRTVQQACDCSGLFWSQELLPAMLQNIYDRPQQVRGPCWLVWRGSGGQAGRVGWSAHRRAVRVWRVRRSTECTTLWRLSVMPPASWKLAATTPPTRCSPLAARL